MRLSGDRALPRLPWFRQHPRLAIVVAGVLYVAVFVLRLISDESGDAYSMLYAFPIALLALTFGRVVGAVAGGIALVLTLGWVLISGVSLGAAGWASRALPLLLLGLVLGDASDRVHRAAEDQRRLEAAAILHREAIEVNDSLLQGMMAAKWALDAGRVDNASQILGQTIDRAQELISNLIRQAGMQGRTEDVFTEGERPPRAPTVC